MSKNPKNPKIVVLVDPVNGCKVLAVSSNIAPQPVLELTVTTDSREFDKVSKGNTFIQCYGIVSNS